MMKLYMITTRDEYELPLVVEENIAVLAEKTGMKPATLYSCISHGYKGYHRIIIEDEDN